MGIDGRDGPLHRLHGGQYADAWIVLEMAGGVVDYALRFPIGGLVVSLFAILGDVLRPKNFAGLFGAAPSVALATLDLPFYKHGGDCVSSEKDAR
ncbi:hypothetical protein ACVSQB_14940 [Bradyrhizobium elkanii]